MRCRKVLFVVRGDSGDAASSRYRVFQYLPLLERQGIGWCVVTPPRRKLVQFYLWLPWLARVLWHGCGSGTIFVQKDIFALSFWKLFKLAGKKIVYDFDDAVFTDEGGRGRAVFSFAGGRSCRDLVSAMVGLSDVTLVANEYLARFARPLGRQVTILPMLMDLAEFPVRRHGESCPVVIGWIGSPDTTQYLSIVEEALAEISRSYGSRVEIRFITNGTVPLAGVPYRQIPWSPAGEIPGILGFDIGIVPLPEDVFTLGKSSFKLLQFMACGLPVVCSAVGFNREAIRDGENGFIADSVAEWIDRLTLLVENPALREAMGRTARLTAEAEFSLQERAADFMAAVVNG